MDFLERRGCPSTLPVPTSTLALFVTSMDLAGYAVPTIATSLSAVSYVHKLAGFPDPAESFLLRKVREGMVRSTPAREPKCGISLELLNEMVLYLSSSQWPDASLYKAIFVLAFHLCSRIGELVSSGGSAQHALRTNQVFIEKRNGVPVSIRVVFHSYKHKQPKGQVVRVVSATGGPSCPVATLVSYLSEGHWSQNEDYLFTSSPGRPVLAHEVRARLNIVLKALGRDPAKYSTHSFRIGGATAAAIQGASDAQLRMLGRWSSSAFLSYIRPGAFRFQYK